MAIDLNQEVIDLDQDVAGRSATGSSYDLGDGRVLYAFASNGEPDMRGFFSIHDLDTGAILAAPRQIDPTTALPPPNVFDVPLTDIFAAQGLANGGVRVYFTQTRQIINADGASTQYVRDFAADGTPAGPSQPLSAPQFFLSGNTVHHVLEDGGIALAHDNGLTVLNADGSVRGGATAPLTFATTDNGYSVVETEGQILVVSTRPGAFPGASAPIQGQLHTLSGAPLGGAVDIVPDPVQPPTTSYSTGEQRLDAARLANGDVVLVYADNFAEGGEGENSQGGLSGLILNPNGTPKGDAFLVNVSETEGRQTWPTVHALDDGGFVVTYDDDSTVENRSVFLRAQQFDASGTPVGEAAFVPQTSLFDRILTEGSNSVIGADGAGLVIDFFGRARTVDVTAEAPDPQDLRGDGDPDELTGDARDNRIEGLGGNDTLIGLGGDDTLIGGPGADTLEGGAGSDVYVVDRADTVIEAADAPGFDEVRTAADLTIPEGVEQLTATGAADLRLNGSAGGDVLVGNAGDNLIVSFGGADTVAGGGGADVFVLTGRGGAAPDLTITDWGAGADRLAVDDQLLGLGSRAIDARDLTPAIFRDLREAGSVGYDGRTGELSLDIDGDGDRELIATLEGGARLGLDDVLLF